MNDEKPHLKRKRKQNKHDNNKRKVEKKESEENLIVTASDVKENSVNSKMES